MAHIKNVSGEDRIVPWLGGRLVVAGAEVEVPDSDVKAYTSQEETWELVKSGAKKRTPDDAQEG